MATASTPSPPAAPWRPPEEFDEYRLLRPLGVGRAGLVFLARDSLLERTVAIKFVPGVDGPALARFLNEARAAARLQHPNVVSLYRVGELDGHPFLVSEHVIGTPLDRLKKPVPWRDALSIGIGALRGMAAAHRRGVLHRDIKPGNVMLAETGEVKLLDFGLARRTGADLAEESDGPGDAPDPDAPRHGEDAPVGTPYYMPPEAWRGEPGSVRSDLYSLGAVLHELAAGSAPFRHVPRERLAATVMEADARALAQAAPGVDARFAAIVDRLLRRDPADRFTSADEALAALLELDADPARHLAVPEGNPYRGLQAFDARHRAVFFGRQREIGEAVERLRNDGFLLVTGDSGVGKSSLCMAGVLPQLEDGALDGGRRWRTVRLVPGRHPVSSIAAALSGSGHDPATLEREIRQEPESIARVLRARLGREEGQVIYVDQLEELVTLSPPEDGANAAQALGRLAGGLPGIRVIGSVRSDFLTRVAGLPGLGALVPPAIFLLRALGPESVREAIVGPARVKGVRFESEPLVEQLVESTISAEGSLPLLQFALAELWDARPGPADPVSAEALARIGGVSGALARHADATMMRLLPAERTAARRILLRLVTGEGTRARRTDAELVGVDPASRTALEALVRARLVLVREGAGEYGGEGGESVYEITHEALVAGWSTLARWIEEEAEARAVALGLEASVREWERSGRTSAHLWNAGRLPDVERLDPGGLTPAETEFLRRSRAHVSRARVLRIAAVLAVVVLAAGIYGGVRWKHAYDRDREIGALAAEAHAIASRAYASVGDLEGLRAEAFRLFDLRAVEEAEASWQIVLDHQERTLRLFREASEAYEKALAVGPERKDLSDAYADLLFEAAASADARNEAALRDVLLHRMRLLDADGSRWARWNAPAALAITTDPPGARLFLAPMERSDDGRRRPGARREIGVSPMPRIDVPPGSHQLTFEMEGRVPVLLPVVLARGDARELNVFLPPPDAIPEGFAYIPPGRFVFGSSAEESVREFFGTVPLHDVFTPGYFIGRTEVTWGAWLEYLAALEPAERRARTPRAGATGLNGNLVLERVAGGEWRLTIQPNVRAYRAVEGEPIRYLDRDRRVEQDWLRMPVSGISFDDAVAYTRWLSETGRVAGARLCSEHEWERAARGADDREYPHGDRLAPDDANIDVTYGKKPLAFGPDEVGAHPGSRSPFGVDDLSGNVWEWVASSLQPGQRVARGGSYYFAGGTARVTNRELPEENFRDLTVGLRVCANYEQ